MHILHISTALSWRGGEQQLAYLLEGLQKKKIAQTVFCFEGSEIQKFCTNQAIDALTIARTSAFNPRLHFKLAGYCKRFKYDLVHAHDAHAHTMAVLAGLLFRLDLKLILSRKVDFPIKDSFFSRYKYNHSSIKKIICVSQKISEILSVDIKNKAVLTTIYDGIDSSRFKEKASGILRKEFGISTSELIIGNVAALADHKDYFTFVDVAELLLQKKVNAKFIIVGDGPERSAIVAYIEKKKLSKSIFLTGFRNDIAKILPEFDVFLFTSKTEGLGSSVLDAYACAVPVVATAAGGVPEIVLHEKTGLLSAVKQPQALADNVVRVLENSELKNSLIANASEWLSHFSKEKNAELTYQVYTEALALS
jgi:glycosyltransferase involved in cell wall biosynthesis